MNTALEDQLIEEDIFSIFDIFPDSGDMADATIAVKQKKTLNIFEKEAKKFSDTAETLIKDNIKLLNDSVGADMVRKLFAFMKKTSVVVVTVIKILLLLLLSALTRIFAPKIYKLKFEKIYDALYKMFLNIKNILKIILGKTTFAIFIKSFSSDRKGLSKLVELIKDAPNKFAKGVIANLSIIDKFKIIKNAIPILYRIHIVRKETEKLL